MHVARRKYYIVHIALFALPTIDRNNILITTLFIEMLMIL